MMWRASSVVLCLLVACVLTWAEHRPSLTWMTAYTSADGIGCCNELDCVPAHVSILTMDDTEATVIVNGVRMVLPRQSVHISEDGASYWCFRGTQPVELTPGTTRCVFYTFAS